MFSYPICYVLLALPPLPLSRSRDRFGVISVRIREERAFNPASGRGRLELYLLHTS